MNDRTVSLRDAGRGRLGAAAENRDIHVRVPFPLDRAQLWVPRRGPTPDPPTSDGPYELVFQRDVLGAMARHATGDPEVSRFGFLLGRLHRCPTSGVHYALVDSVLPADEEFVEEAPGAYLLRAWADAQAEFRRHPGVLVGWYHSHRLLGLLLSEGDMDANRRYFNEAWQCCVLFVPDEARPLGSLFRPGSQASGRKPPDPASFWEIPSEGKPAPSHPVLDWTNYEVRRDVHVPGLPVPDRSEVEPRATNATPGGPVEMHSGSGARPVSVVIPDASADSRPIAPRRRMVSWTSVMAMIVILTIIAVLVLQSTRSDAPIPIARPTIQRPARPTESPDLLRFREIATELRTSIDRYQERSGDFDLGRIGCDLLTTGYGLIDESFIRFVAMHARLDPEPGSEAAREFDRLSEEVDDVNRHFDSTGCPRPE